VSIELRVKQAKSISNNQKLEFRVVVKNRFSNLKKVQTGWDQQGKDVTNNIGRGLSKRADMKENKLRWVCLQQRRLTPSET